LQLRWELEVAPPEGLSAWNASRAEQSCQVAVPEGVELTTGPLGSQEVKLAPQEEFAPHSNDDNEKEGMTWSLHDSKYLL